jgi:hypothetical protein
MHFLPGRELIEKRDERDMEHQRRRGRKKAGCKSH